MSKKYHISDLLTVTTGRLVSNRHMDGIYDILGHLSGEDGLFTHQLLRVMKEVEPWLEAQFPTLMKDSDFMVGELARLDNTLEERPNDPANIAEWVESVRVNAGLPEWIPVYAMSEDMHTRIDPIAEAKAMFGDDRVAVVGGHE